MVDAQNCSACGEANSTRARFCQSCGLPLAEPAPQESRRVVTILFSDIVDSTTVAEQLDPEALRRLMARYFEAMSSVIRSHGGTIEKFIGDAILAIFGVPVLHGDDAFRAVHCALEMRRELETINEFSRTGWGIELQTRTGIHSGEVIAGDSESGQFIVTGDAVNLAMRLQEMAPTGDILLSEATLNTARGLVQTEPLLARRVKGFKDPVDVHRLIDIGSDALRTDEAFIGRRDEISRLEAFLWDVVRRGRGGLALVVGDAGIGKSRLLSELQNRLPRSMHFALGRCSPFGQRSPMDPVVQVILQLTRSAPDTSQHELEGVITRVFDDAEVRPEPRERSTADALPDLLGLRKTRASVRDNIWSLREFLRTLDRFPLLLVFDDVQWADEGLLELIHFIAEEPSEPLAVIGLARPEFTEGEREWPGISTCDLVLQMEGLPSDEASELVEEVSGQSAISDDVKEEVFNLSGGNPYFITEMSVMLRTEQEASGDPESGRLKLPASLQAILAARLDRLEAASGRFLECASVLGEVFSERELTSVLDEDLLERRDELIATAFRSDQLKVDEATGKMRFKHILLRDVAYERMPRLRRADLHVRFADWLENNESSLNSSDERIGFHLEQAAQSWRGIRPPDDEAREASRRAAERLGRAGEAAFWRVESPRAIDLLTRAIDLLEKDDKKRLELLLMLTEEVLNVGDLEFAWTLIEDLTESAQRLSDERILAHARSIELVYRTRTDRHLDIEAIKEEAREQEQTFTRLEDHQGLSATIGILSFCEFLQGRYGRAADLRRKSLTHAELSGDVRDVAWAKSNLVEYELFGPTPLDDVVRLSIELIDAAVLDGRRIDQGDALDLLACAYALRGDFEEARSALERTETIFKEVGLAETGWRLHVYWSGVVEMLSGDLEQARLSFGRALSVNQAMGQASRAAVVATLLAECEWALGRISEVDTLVQLAQNEALREDLGTQAHWRALKGRLLASKGQSQAARQIWEEGVGLLGDGFFVNMFVWMAGTELFALLGDEKRARFASAMAREMAQLKGSVALKSRVDVLESRIPSTT